MAAVDLNELKNIIKHLQKENSALQHELDSLQENTVISSMNDMRHAYSAVVKKNLELELKCAEFEANPSRNVIESLEKKVAIYGKMFRILQKRAQKSLVASELIEKALKYSADDEGDIDMSAATLEGVVSVQHAANADLERFFEYELPRYKECLHGMCERCYRCDVDMEDEI